MLTRKTLLAIAATAALGASALGTTEASAWGFHGFGYHSHIGSHFGSHWAFHRYGYHWGYRHFYRWNTGWYRPHFWRYRWISYHRPYLYGAVGAAAVAAPISGAMQRPMAQPTQPAQAPGNCLVKQYLQNGTVVFQDICTQETAVAPTPGGMGQNQNPGGMGQNQGPAGPAGQ
jgi:hypothetical protein